MQWSNPDTVVQKLKEMLWSLQALRIFDLKLEGALDKIEDAKKSLELTIAWVGCNNSDEQHISLTVTILFLGQRAPPSKAAGRDRSGHGRVQQALWPAEKCPYGHQGENVPGRKIPRWGKNPQEKG